MAPDDRHFLALGKLAHNFALLEQTVDLAVWAALGDMDDRRFRAVTSDLSFSARLRLLGTLADIVETRDESPRAKERERRWKDFLRRAEGAAIHRNRLLHSPLGSSNPGKPENMITTFRVSRSNAKRGSFEFDRYTYKDLAEVANTVFDVREQLLDLLMPEDVSHDSNSSEEKVAEQRGR